MSDKNTFKMHLKCYNCGHKWYHIANQGERYYSVEKSGVSCIHEDIGSKKTLTGFAHVVCPYCQTFSDITNITSQWAPQSGYGGIEVDVEEDDTQKIQQAIEEKEKAKQEVIKMEEKKKS